MSTSYFFGYGSLVNRRTHGFAPAHRATASGWRRVWAQVPGRPVSLLTVLRDPNCEIEGLIAPVDADGWAALDLREACYDRTDALHDVRHPEQPVEEMAIYVVPEADRMSPDVDHPVLLSYLDVVLQGYLVEFGKEGAERFLASTANWDAPILNDRAAPQYPRAQSLTDAEQRFVDAALSRLGAKVFAE
ncbi:gamma-glutamylcyclotransferase family protein [Salipiger mangrovisoli]|uniref:Gamma-glutamylcyclotransferase n=1 Tax=Salipiger mangrovisoli TaxID=2865933 RepID=A0ABR9X283_9RHOB|nr:gamma-glutamylcyclotransferase family protein [Salipiger mangrovisoli]MBE9637582.1 gamma-glutamylcyclotransferase [Salipiger mangrovisoli]